MLRIAFLLLMGGLSACASVGALSVPAEQASAGVIDTESAQVTERLLVNRAFLRLSVGDDPGPVATQVGTLVEGAGGYVESSSAGNRRADFTLRIPAPELNRFLDAVQRLGTTEERRVLSEDVTESSADLDARIENLAAVRDRLRSHLDRAGDIADIISVERELARVQTELDILEGRRGRMQRDVSYSVVSLQIERKRVLGPLGLVAAGAGWLLTRLIFIR